MLGRLKRLSKQSRVVLANMIGAFGVKGLSLLLSLMTMPAYMRFFQNMTVLGVWFTIVSVLNWIMYFDLGLGNGLRNKLPEALEKHEEVKVRELISTTYFIMTGFVFILGMIGIGIIPILEWNRIFNVDSSLISHKTLSNCVFIVYFGILFQFIAKLVTSVLYAIQKSAVVNFMSLISSALIVSALYIFPSSSIEINLYTMAVINVIAMLTPSVVISFWVYGYKIKKSFPQRKYFKKEYVSDITKIGVSLLWLQLVFMIISSTNEFLISNFTSPDYVVEYQAYYKIFKTGGMLFSLALTPIWSAVTKAQARKDYEWIRKVYKLFLLASFLCLAIELGLIPFLQTIMDVWLKEDSITVSTMSGLVFSFSATIFVVHNVNTAIGNGISYFKVQMIWMSFAALIDIPLAYFLVRVTGSWIGIIIANVVALLPYEILAPIYTMRKLASTT